MRIGVLTGGGDCPGLNAVIRAVTKSLILQCDADVIGFEDGFLGLIENRYKTLDYRTVSGIIATGGTILGTHNKANPFSYYKEGGADVSDRVVANYKALNLDAIVVIGGDGTMTGANALQKKGINMVGVPKTIDNDLMHTERTFGFDTAVSIATDALDRLQTTGQSHSRVMILEVMGRYAGWIALHAGIAGGADIILIPELPFDMNEVARVCKAREERQRFTVIAVAEGAAPKDGEMIVRERVEGSADPIRLGGIGNYIKNQLGSVLESDIRTTVLGHIQRGGSPTAFDRTLATAFGCYAASLVSQRQFGTMVALQNNTLVSVPLSQVANKNRTVPSDSLLVATGRLVGTSFGIANSVPNWEQFGDEKTFE